MFEATNLIMLQVILPLNIHCVFSIFLGSKANIDDRNLMFSQIATKLQNYTDYFNWFNPKDTVIIISPDSQG